MWVYGGRGYGLVFSSHTWEFETKHCNTLHHAVTHVTCVYTRVVSRMADWSVFENLASKMSCVMCYNHDLCIYVTRLVHVRNMWHVSFMYMWHDSFIYVTWLVHICDMIRSYMWYDSSISFWHAAHVWWHNKNLAGECFTNCHCGIPNTVLALTLTYFQTLISTHSFSHNVASYSDVTRSYIWRDLFVCVTWLAHICDTTKTWQANVSRTVALALTTPSLHSHSPPASYGMVSLHALSSIRSKTPFSGSPVCTTWLVHTHDTTHRFYQIHTVIKPLENTPFRIVHMYGILHRSYVWHDEHCLTTYTL